MRIWEILSENYVDDLETDIDNLLIGANAAGLSSVKTEVVVKKLQQMGYSIDKDTLIQAVAGKSFVASADENEISFDEEPEEENDEGKSAEHVKKLAQDASKLKESRK